MKRYKSALTNTHNPWPNLGVKLLEASMVECEDGEYIKHSPMQEAAPKMYKFLDDLANGRGTDYPIEKLLAEARGEL